MIVPVMLEFGTQGMLGVVLNAMAVVVTRSIKIVNATPIVTKLRLFVDGKDTVLENRRTESYIMNRNIWKYLLCVYE